MTRQKILVLKGLPASGKSTFALSLVDQGWVRTNKDTIRAEQFPNYTRKDEKKVVRERNRQIVEALKEHKNVVVDDTNLNPVHIKDLANIARQNNADFEVDDSFLDVPLLETIERDSKREGTAQVGEQVIRGMYHQYIGKPRTAVEYDPNLSACYLVDIDGTLAKMNGKRSPFEWHKVGEDTVNEGLAHILDGISLVGYAKIFLLSGRDEVCRPETEDWLERNAIDYDMLVMRPKGDMRPDTEVKMEMFNEHIRGKYNVLMVFDDRVAVAKQWRDTLGLEVAQLGDPYHQF